jgi:probable HAF family extracellular repeat protein
MKSTALMRIAATALFAVLLTPPQNIAHAQQPRPNPDPLPHYIVTDLGTLGGTFSIAFGVNRAARVGGGATLSNGNEHPFLWSKERGMQDLGTLGGPNGNAGGPNGGGALAVLSETSKPDPLGEDFCGFGTHLQCLAAFWNDGVMTPLPTLGGNNGQGFGINDRDQVIGIAETSRKDKSCAAPQVLDYEAAIWGPREGEIQELRPLPGDTVGFALGLNDRGDVVGATGTCANTPLFPLAFGPHALLWQNGSPIDLGNLGGNLVNVAAAINDRGEVVGTASLPGNTADPAFLWTRGEGMQNIGTLGTDKSGLPGGFGGINNVGQVVGQSCSGYAGTGNCRAFLWQDNVMTDLNTLIPADSPLYLVVGGQINDAGEIVGLGVTSSGQSHAFLATPQRDH